MKNTIPASPAARILIPIPMRMRFVRRFIEEFRGSNGYSEGPGDEHKYKVYRETTEEFLIAFQ